MNTPPPSTRTARPSDRAFSRIQPLHEASVAYRDAVRAADRAFEAIGRILTVDPQQDLSEGSVWWLAQNDIAVRESLLRLTAAMQDLKGLAEKQGAAAVAETSSLMALTRWVGKVSTDGETSALRGDDPKERAGQ
ncbi:MAG: hypothetical protein ACKO2D_04815 [Chloroflexota bacterium]